MSAIQAQVQDPRLIDIRNSVAQKSDAIPFLLLPVRIETRFMQVSRQSQQVTATIESVLEGMAYVQIEAINTQANLTGDNIRNLTNDIGNITTAVKALGNLQVRERGWLKQLFNDTAKDVQLVVSASQSVLAPDSQNLDTAIKQLGASVLATKLLNLGALSAARDLLNGFNSVDITLQILNGVNKKKVPYTDVKNKKSLYGYIINTLSGVLSFYQTAGQKATALQFIDKAQRTRINQLQTDIQNQLTSLSGAIGNLHKDASWKNFVQKDVDPLITDITNLSNAFASGPLPALNNLPEPPALQTGDVYFSGLKALVKIKRFNLNPKKGYEVIKNYKAYLEPRVTTLARTIQSPIVETRPGQIQQLQSLYGAINTELQTSITRIDAYGAANKSQQAGKGLISTYFNKDVLNVISGFAGVAGQNFPGPVYIPSPPEPVNQLWVRIYPDDIFVMTHEDALTPDETKAGKQFWKTWWAVSGDKDAQMGAWQNLCTAFGPNRASWIVRTLHPAKNPDNHKILKAGASAKIQDASKMLDSINSMFRELPLDATIDEMAMAQGNHKMLTSIHSNLEKVHKELSDVSSGNAFFVDKIKSQFIRVAGYFNHIVQKPAPSFISNAHVAFNQHLNAIHSHLGHVQNELKKIKSLSHKSFLDSIPDPFIYPRTASKKDSWTVAPHTNCLPERFVVITMKGDQFTRISVGNPVDSKLQLGLDPQKFNDLSLFQMDSNGNLNIDDRMKWMTDYDVAVSKGMGITLDITDDEYNNGFDRLIVLGIKDSDSVLSKQLLELLVMNHIYSVDGMDFLKVGTPTNNTHQASSGWLSTDDVTKRYNIEVNNIKYDKTEKDPLNKADGKYLCDALGLDNEVIQYVNDSGNQEIANAFAVNRALWGASLGHYMEEMWDGMFTYDNIRRTENFFTGYCLGRGVVPSLRIGMQPYGIITTTAFSQLQL